IYSILRKVQAPRMSLFSEGFSSRTPSDIVLVSGHECLTAGDGSGIRPSLKTQPAGHDLRLALSLRSTIRLAEVLSAYDGLAEAMLLLDSALPSEMVTAMAEATRCGLIVSDRTDIAQAIAPENILSRASAATPP